MGTNQVSGAFSLDLSGLADQVAERLRPDIAALRREITADHGHLFGAEDTGRIIGGAMNAGTPADAARWLLKAGYAIVRVAPPAQPGQPSAGGMPEVSPDDIPVVDIPVDDERSATDHRLRPLWRTNELRG